MGLPGAPALMLMVGVISFLSPASALQVAGGIHIGFVALLRVLSTSAPPVWEVSSRSSSEKMHLFVY